jgi:hypothetical protein
MSNKLVDNVLTKLANGEAINVSDREAGALTVALLATLVSKSSASMGITSNGQSASLSAKEISVLIRDALQPAITDLKDSQPKSLKAELPANAATESRQTEIANILKGFAEILALGVRVIPASAILPVGAAKEDTLKEVVTSLKQEGKVKVSNLPDYDKLLQNAKDFLSKIDFLKGKDIEKLLEATKVHFPEGLATEQSIQELAKAVKQFDFSTLKIVEVPLAPGAATDKKLSELIEVIQGLQKAINSTDYSSITAAIGEIKSSLTEQNTQFASTVLELDFAKNLPRGEFGLLIEAQKTKGYRRSSTKSANADSIKDGAGEVVGLVASNINKSEDAFLKFYDKKGSPDVGKDSPVATILIPAGETISLSSAALPFEKGLGLGITRTPEDASAQGVNANEVFITAWYR